MSKHQRIVVFDLDETLGSFSELGMFWNALEKILGHQTEDHFFEILDLYPEFLRPKIINIIKYINSKRKDGLCDKIMIYTNNQGPCSWAKMIAKYFDQKIGNRIFDQIIAAFKVKGKIIEINRTSHNKSISDLFKCTKLPPETQFCFLDDQFHPEMRGDNVYYINVKPYTYSLRFDTMAERYYNTFVPNIKRYEFINKVIEIMSSYRYTHIDKDNMEKDVDEVISKQILLHLEQFFQKSKSITRKKRILSKRLTKKRYNYK